MSLDCRILKKFGTDEVYYYCRNNGVTPTEISLWTDPAETPKEIEHYFKNIGMITIGPDMANYFGILDKLYPNFPNCGMPEYKSKPCIGEACGKSPNGNWEKCPYFQKKT